MSKNKQRKKKKLHAEKSPEWQLRQQTHYQLNNWTAMKSSNTVTLEFEYDGTLYRGTAYPVEANNE